MTNDPIFELICSLLSKAHQDDSPLSAAEALYNEGWLLRLSLALHTSQIKCLPVEVARETRWLSEPLMYTPFRATHRGDKLAERHTHADAVLGHVGIAPDAKRGLTLNEDATQLVVFEAKMDSPLSSGTRNASTYDQAVRNVACIAETLSRRKRSLGEMKTLAFYVISPERWQTRHQPFLNKSQMKQKVLTRIQLYDSPHRERLDRWRTEWYEPVVDRIDLQTETWESIIQKVKDSSKPHGEAFQQFYERCTAAAETRDLARVPPPLAGGPVIGNCMYRRQGRNVWLHQRDIGRQNCRVVLVETIGDYFPRSDLVPQHELEPLEPPVQIPIGLAPVVGSVYQWTPPPGEQPNPPRGTEQPTAPQPVQVTGVGTETCRVHPPGNPTAKYLVYTHHLRRESTGP